MLSGLLRIRSRAGASAWLLAAAAFVLTAWLQAHLAITALHDDGSALRGTIGAVQQTGLDEPVLGVVGELFGAADALSTDPTAVGALEGQVVGSLSEGITPAIEDALVETALAVRNAALLQLESDDPTTPLEVPLGPLISSLGVAVTPEVTASLGATDAAQLAIPIMSAESVDRLRGQYRWIAPLDAWGLVVAGALALAGVLLSPKPWRTLTIALSIGGIACLVAVPLFDVLKGWMLSGGLGAWGSLLTPFIDGAVGDLRPLFLPVGIAAVVAAAGIGVWRFLVARKAAEGPADAVGTDVAPAEQRPFEAVPETT